MTMSTDLVKFINKQVSRISKNINMMRTVLTDWMLIVLAYLSSFFLGERKKSVPVLKLNTKSEQDVAINCLGSIDLRSNTALFREDLHSIQSVLADADIFLSSFLPSINRI